MSGSAASVRLISARSVPTRPSPRSCGGGATPPRASLSGATRRHCSHRAACSSTPRTPEGPDMQRISIRLTGSAPLLMHSARLADPLDSFAVALGKATSKRAKTVADCARMAEIEWHGGLWTVGGRPCIIGEAIEAPVVGCGQDAPVGKLGEGGDRGRGELGHRAQLTGRGGRAFPRRAVRPLRPSRSTTRPSFALGLGSTPDRRWRPSGSCPRSSTRRPSSSSSPWPASASG